MTKVLLVNPPFYRLLGSHYNANSLGIAYVASYLNNNGHDAWLYNADHLGEDKYANLEKIFGAFDDYKKFFADYNNPVWEEVVDKIIAFNPEWVGYTSYTANVGAIKILSSKLKKVRPNIKQVIGGVHATLEMKVLDKLPDIDYSVLREGEEVMLSLVNNVPLKDIKGITYRDENNKLINNGIAPIIKDIDNLPYPERDKFYGITEEEKTKVDVSYMVTIRGCPYQCTYCASPFHWDRKTTRLRSPESVIAEMKHLKKNYWNNVKKYDFAASANSAPKDQLKIEDNTMVYFVDDVFTVNKKRVKIILRMMIKEKLNMKWKCEARTDNLDNEIAELLNEAGCVRVKLGFESGSDKILKQVKKLETREEMLHGARLLKDNKVSFSGYFMTGFPGETDEDLQQTIDFAKEVKANYYSLSVLAPYYGTELFNDLMAKGHALDKQPWEYFFHQSPELMVNNTISPGMLKKFLELNQLNQKNNSYL
jgi:anaerobic magnesium-protoporphyrin IX monomethyl ester cyclase